MDNIMSNFKDFISSGGGGGADKLNLLNPASGLKVLVKASMTYTPSIDCTVVVTCIGAGGGGGQVAMNQSFKVSGGAAGGVCQSELSLTSGTTYTITIGGGGNASAAGGNTTFTGSNITDMTANGGTAGGWTNTGSTTKAGGTAVGGNIANHTGGSAIIVAANNSGSFGGAACGFFETGKNSASSTSTNMTIGAGIDIPPTDLIPELTSDPLGGSSAGGEGYSTAGTGDFGCGGGAGYISIYSTSNSHYVTGGKGGIGAGGGGGYAWNNRSGNSASASGGAGGNGMVILDFV
jgi:hypothetical protein